jgi:sec-independent protein translocase protein TatA
MGTFSIWHWLIVLVVVLVLFGGGGKIPKLMRDMGKGINAFKKGLKEDKEEAGGEDGEPKSIKKSDTAEVDAPAEEKEKEKTGTDA